MADPELLRLIEGGWKVWNTARKKGVVASRPDLVGADLRHVALSEFNLSNADLSNALLAGAQIGECALHGATLDGADLTGATLRNGRLPDASLRGASLRGADLRDARLRGADLTGADLTDARLDKCWLVDACLDDVIGGSGLDRAYLEDAKSMWAALPLDRPLTLRLQTEADPDRGDRPFVRILIAGDDIFERAGYLGFHPDDLFCEARPLLPADPPRRVAVYQCGCEHPGCGCVAPLITREGAEVVWRDFRTFTDVYSKPDSDPGVAVGAPLAIPSLRFDADAYEAEVARSSRDRSWETR